MKPQPLLIILFLLLIPLSFSVSGGDWWNPSTWLTGSETEETLNEIGKKETLKKADEKISNVLKNTFNPYSRPENKFRLFITYLFLRFEHNVIQRIFKGSWIFFGITILIIVALSIYFVKMAKKKREPKYL